MASPLILKPRAHVRGTLRVPGDKSISHRALLFAAIARGESRITGLAPGEDVRTTRRVLAALGVAIEDDHGAVVVRGRGLEGIDRDPRLEPLTLDCGNSGTTTRLLLGLLAGRRGRFRLVGDGSLSRRPMARVVEPLRRMGARIEGGDTLPLTIEGGALTAIEHRSPVASAQIKSALILAGLQARGRTSLVEPRLSRDHTERMLRPMGAVLAVDRGVDGGGGAAVHVDPLEGEVQARDLAVPGDPSSAAYAIALACLLPESEVRIEGVSTNITRLGFYDLLTRMGASLRIETHDDTGEPVGAIVARTSPLEGCRVDGDDVVDAIDEIPLVACVASQAAGETVIAGADELRVKESDRVHETVSLLRAFGAHADERVDGLRVLGGAPLRGAAADAKHDHRIAMCAAVLAALAEGESVLTGTEWVAISYPSFFEDLDRLSSAG